MSAEPRELLAAAIEAARRAGRVLAERFPKARTIELKGGIDLVTDADRASEAVLLEFLRAEFPSHSILAEESGLKASATSTHRWFVDPLDGTTNYAHQVPHFCVSIGVSDAAGIVAGVVLDPIRDELFAAARGAGATLNGTALRPSRCDAIASALLCTGFPYDVHQRPEVPVGLFNRFIRKAQGVRRMGSAALDLAYVASGRFDGFFEFGLKPWDLAGGAALVLESGARMMRIDGAPLDLSIGHVLAAGPALYETLQRECAAFLTEVGWTV